MGKRDLKEKIKEIEDELKVARQESDSAVYSNVMSKLYLLLISKEAIRYFGAIYKKTGAKEFNLAKEPEDYLSDLWMEVCVHYDPLKGNLMNFLTFRMKNRILDDERKSGGIVGQLRNDQNREKIIFVSSDQPIQIDHEIISDRSILDEEVLNQHENDEDLFLGELVMDAQLHELASQILHFMDNRNRQRDRMQYLYYRLFYSTDIINYLKLTGDVSAFRHERDVLGAIHFLYTNFCTDRKEQYTDKKEMTIHTIFCRQLALKGEVLPDDKIKEGNREERLNVPLQNEVVRGYLERKENICVSSSSISQTKKRYMIFMNERLGLKELSYARIAMP